MGLNIARGQTKFGLGISEPQQLEEFLSENPQAVGASFVGRSNVGKSSLINTLYGRKVARVSNTPGRTREINVFEFLIEDDGKVREDLPAFILFDLPGYGHAEVPAKVQRNWEELMTIFFEKVSPAVLMLNLQDARHPSQKSDLAFQDFLSNHPLETFMVFNKIDKLKRQKERSQLEKLKPQLYQQLKWVKQIHFVSAESRQGIDQLEAALIDFLLLKHEALSQMNA